MNDTFFFEKKSKQNTASSFYLKLLQAKPPLFISAFQGSLPAPVTHKNQSWAAAHLPSEAGSSCQWYVLSWLTGALLCATVISEQKTLSFYSPFPLPLWDENKLIQNRKHSFSNSSSESKLPLFIDSQVSWNDQHNVKHKLTLNTKCEHTHRYMLPIWPFWPDFFFKKALTGIMIYCKKTKKAPTCSQS